MIIYGQLPHATGQSSESLKTLHLFAVADGLFLAQVHHLLVKSPIVHSSVLSVHGVGAVVGADVVPE